MSFCGLKKTWATVLALASGLTAGQVVGAAISEYWTENRLSDDIWKFYCHCLHGETQKAQYLLGWYQNSVGAGAYVFERPYEVKRSMLLHCFNEGGPLHTAAEEGHTKTVQWLLSLFDDGNRVYEVNEDKPRLSDGNPVINVNTGNGTGETPLHLAARNGHEAVVRMLMQVPGIDITAKTKWNYTPLHLAAMHGRAAVVKLLLPQIGEEDINTGAGTWAATPLYEAVEKGHTEVVALLLNRPDINVNCYVGGLMPLLFALKNFDKDRTEIVRLLLAHPNLNINARTHTHHDDFLHIVEGVAALHMVAGRGLWGPEVLRLILNRQGVEINGLDDDGNTALHNAARGCAPGDVEDLLQYPGIGVLKKNVANQTALDIINNNIKYLQKETMPEDKKQIWYQADLDIKRRLEGAIQGFETNRSDANSVGA